MSSTQPLCTHLAYIDESQDQSANAHVLTALLIPCDDWQANFHRLLEYRKALKRSDRIYVRQELHAWKFVSGRGHIAERTVFKGRRCQIFKEILALASSLSNIKLFNAIAPLSKEMMAFERMLNRINKTMEVQGGLALLICDEGKDKEYTQMRRKMGVFNPIPSNQGVWQDTGAKTRNIPLDRIIEDPFFKRSENSLFIQLVDFCAYALLRREHQLPSKNKYGLHEAFQLLDPILFRAASTSDPEGIIRIT